MGTPRKREPRYYVTRRPNQDFVGLYLLAEIQRLVRHKQIVPTWYVTMSDGRSFAAFSANNTAQWLTITEFLLNQPELANETPRPVDLASLASHHQVSEVILGIGGFCSVIGSLMLGLSILFSPGTSIGKGGGVIVFFFSGIVVFLGITFAMVCARTLALNSVIQAQDAENRRLWEAIDKLREQVDPPQPK